jgi:serine/threonine-protein kinase
MASGWERGAPRALGRYVVFDEIAAGGMASVHVGRHLGPLGFCRTVAIKRLHAQFAKDPEFVAMFVDEARLAARVQHPNVVATLDVVTAPEELLLVMDYIHGETLSRLLEHARPPGPSPAIASAIMSDALYGLHAAHEAKDENNEALRIVHRDVSPQNMLVGVDGATRMLDFGIAKASTRSQVTRDGQVKGKLAYMAPEQVRGRPVDRRADVFAASVVLWELLTGERLFSFEDPAAAVYHILSEPRRPPSELADVSKELDEVVLRGLAHNAADRFPTARDMAAALEAASTPASDAAVARWVEELAGAELADRHARIAAMERLPARAVQREITRATSQGQAEIRSLLRVVLERDERAEAETEADALDDALDASTTVPEGPLPTAAAATPLATPVPARVLKTPIDDGVATRPVAREERTPRWLIAVVATLIGAGTVFVLLRQNPPENVQSKQESAPSESESAPPAPSASVAAAPDPVGASPETSASAPLVRPTPPTVPRPATVAPKATAKDCTPPFYFENGIKRYKRHCFAPH